MLPKTTRLGHYEILAPLGAGGMGEVYLAEDTRLRRKVALKVLSEKIAADADRLLRFEREAYAASALNHPNILTVHEFGVENGVHFLVTELIEGATLREKIHSDKLTVEDALSIAEQIANAVSAAHAAGIIHRDIKPENIMLRTDGIVKVLDFGLAKLTGSATESAGSQEQTLMQITNRRKHGALMGTLRYMSPEQVRGQPLDVRSDIFSFGVVIYEMLTGKDPFHKATSMDIIAAILTETPAPITDTRDDAPVELQRIVSKALAKEREERYQTGKELLSDLKSLIKEIEFSGSRERITRDDKARNTDEVETQVTNAATVRRFSLLHALVTFVAVSVTIGGIWWLILRGNSATQTPPPSALATVAVVNWRSRPGEIYSTGSFSPDGRMAAFTSTKSGTKNIWITLLSGGEAVQVDEAVQVTKDTFTNQNPIWSPDGNEIALYSTRGGTSGIWRIPALGGTPIFIKTISDAGMALRYWSKKEVIYYVGNRNLFALDLKSGQSAQLTNFDATKVSPNTISISPDEERIVSVTFEDQQYVISTIPVRGGSARQLARNANEIRNTIWHPDNKRILYSALVTGVFQVFVTDINGSPPTQITFGDKDSLALDVSTDGTKILYGSSKEESDVWGVKVEDGEEFSFAADINSELWANVSPDSKTVAYQSINNLSQGDKIFSGAILTKPTASEAQAFQLVANGFLPSWSPDGKQLAFMRVTGETYNLWAIKATGGQEKQLTTEGLLSVEFSVLPYNRTQTSNFSWSPDSKKLAYISNRSGQRNIWLVDATDASNTQLTDNSDANLFIYCPLWSSDGKRLTYSSKSNRLPATGKSLYTTFVLDIETKTTKAVLQSETFQRLLGWSQTDQEVILATLDAKNATELPTEVNVIQVNLQTGGQRQIAKLEAAYLYNIHLSSDKKMIAYASHRDDKDNLWVMRVSGGEARKLTANNDPRLYYSNLSWSPDNRALYFGKQTRHSLLSMITNFR